MQESATSHSLGIVARSLWLLLAMVVALVAMGAATLLLIDRPPGHAFILRALTRLELESGLTIRAGSIEGSLFNKLRVHDLEIGDPKGVFLIVPVADIDWRPRDLLGNLLTVRSAIAPEIRVLRLPQFHPTADPRILPDMDFAISSLRVDRLVLEPAVAGRQHVLTLTGDADIRSGRALVNLDAHATTAGDTLKVALDSEPDRDKFDVDVRLEAPAGGVIDGITKLGRPLSISIDGAGSWHNWTGKIDARSGKVALATLALTANQGDFGLRGLVTPVTLLHGPAQTLVAPQVNISVRAIVADRVATTTLHLDSSALTIDANGRLDFAAERFGDTKVGVWLRNPAALDPKVSGQDVRVAARIAGSFARPLVDYTLTAQRLGYGDTMLFGPRVSGIVELGAVPLRIPVAASASRITGLGATATPLLTNVRLDGLVNLGDHPATIDNLTLRTDRLNARGTARLRLPSGDLALAIKALLPNYSLPGTGTADLSGDLVITTTAAQGTQINGAIAAVVTRLENAGLAAFLGGMPRLTGNLAVAPDFAIRFNNARLVAPALDLVANGSYSPSGVVAINGNGTLRDYGPVQLAVKGRADAPTVDVLLAAPGVGIGLADFSAQIAPVAQGWSFKVSSRSQYGPVKGNGVIKTANTPLTIDVSSLSAAGLDLRGSASATSAGPFSGQFGIHGDGINGTVTLSAAGATQRADIAVDARNAKLDLATPVTIGEARLVGTMTQPPSGPFMANGTLHARNVLRSGTLFAAVNGDFAYTDRSGHAKISASGSTDSPFTADFDARLAGDHITVAGGGTIDGRNIRLADPAQLTRIDGSWHLAPTVIRIGDGRAEFSGVFGDDFALNARLDHVGLSALTVINPALDFSGTLTGTIDLKFPAGGSLPTGSANLRVNGLSRAGFATASTRIDLGINAVIANGSASARAVIARAGKIEGRAQAQLPVIPGGRADPLLTRLLASPLVAQLRWSGPAQAIWPLTGVESIDVRGPMTVAADISGVLGDPSFSGTLSTDNGRVESTAIGLVIDKIVLASRFSESRLDIIKFSGSAGKDGQISGTGGIDLSAVRNFPLDFKLDLKNALLLNRDDLHVAATGPVHIRNDGEGARITGKLEIDRARITIGGASVEDVPVLKVAEINRDISRRAIAIATSVKPTIWQLDMSVHANNKVDVRGMGLDSEWSGDLKVTGSAFAPRLVGKVQLVRGDYDFAGKRFTLTRGDVRFSGSYPPDPTINITAENTSSSLTATLNITGTAQRPQISFSSVPALPEDEVLSRVLFGESITNLSAPEALQLAGALATLRGGSGGLNPINMVRKGLGIDRLRILPADTATGRKTSVAAGQYIGDRVYVEVASDAQGYNATSVEVSLTRSLSILSQIATLGGTSVNLRWKRDY